MQDIVDILQFFHENRDKPVTSTIALMFLLLVGEKVLRWYFKRQKGTIEQKLDLLLRDRGIEWNDAERYSMTTFQTKLRNFILSFWVIPFHALIAKLFTNWREKKMPQINRVWLFTIIAFLGGMISKRMGVEFSDEIYNEVTDFIIFIVLPLAGFALDKFKTKEVTDEKHPVDSDSAV